MLIVWNEDYWTRPCEGLSQLMVERRQTQTGQWRKVKRLRGTSASSGDIKRRQDQKTNELMTDGNKTILKLKWRRMVWYDPNEAGNSIDNEILMTMRTLTNAIQMTYMKTWREKETLSWK